MLYFADGHTEVLGRVRTNGDDYQTLHNSPATADPFGIVKVVGLLHLNVLDHYEVICHDKFSCAVLNVTVRLVHC